jgi:hypothetical protein
MPFRRNLANLRIKKAREITVQIIMRKSASGPRLFNTMEPLECPTPDDMNYVEWTLMAAAYGLERHLLTTEQA